MHHATTLFMKSILNLLIAFNALLVFNALVVFFILIEECKPNQDILGFLKHFDRALVFHQ